MHRRRPYTEEQEEDESIYSQEFRESLMEDDALTPFEEAFMDGYDKAV